MKLNRHSTRKKKNHTIIDLFCGAGGISLGAARAGFAIGGAVDLDTFASNTYKQNFPKTAILNADISKLDGQMLTTLFNVSNGDLSGIVGGPPCQGFSNIGKRDRNDPRNALFVDFFRLVAESLPRFFLVENVPGILRESNSDIRNAAFAYIESKYIFLPEMCLSAGDYGAPTIRKRVFFFGYLKDEMESLVAANFKPPTDVEVVKVKAALDGLPIKINPNWQKEEQGWRIVKVHGNGYFRLRLHGHIPKGVGNSVALARLKKESRASGSLGTVHSQEVIERYAGIKPGQYDPISKSQRLNPSGFCPTLRAGTDSDHGSYQAIRPLHPTESRVITPREAARLQGFPDWFQFSSTKWHSFRQIGSSVSPIIAEQIFRIILNALH